MTIALNVPYVVGCASCHKATQAIVLAALRDAEVTSVALVAGQRHHHVLAAAPPPPSPSGEAATQASLDLPVDQSLNGFDSEVA